jgi:hypothetical protein
MECTTAAATGSPTYAVTQLARGIVVKGLLRNLAAVIAISVAAAGLAVIGRGASASTAEAPFPVPMVPAAAPVPKPPEDPLLREIATTRRKAIRFLMDKRNAQGTWEGSIVTQIADMEGGETALVALCLEEAGVKPDDPSLTSALKYLEKLVSKKTYVVSLQTRVLAKADSKRFAAKIQTNVDWLLDTAIGFKTGGRLDGWSYPMNPIADGSNTHFAVAALNEAAQAGAKVDPKVWPAMRELYLRTRKEAGWAYDSGQGAGGLARPTRSMTLAAMFGLAVAAKHDQDADVGRGAFEKGMVSLFDSDFSSVKSAAYDWMVTAELGRTAGLSVFKAGGKESNWYREGARELLKLQQADGSFKPPADKLVDRYPVFATAFGLYFLGPPGAK